MISFCVTGPGARTGPKLPAGLCFNNGCRDSFKKLLHASHTLLTNEP